MATKINGGQPPPQPPGHIIEDEEEFLDDVEAYMKKRKVPFIRDGQVSGRPAPLHKLFKMVMAKGGYDAVTAEKMAWRGIAKNFHFPNAHEGAMSYQLKLLYYKNLAAYEIEKLWRETPPAPDILERLTAKGGDVRRRTRASMPVDTTDDNDKSRVISDAGLLTPKQEKVELDEQESAGRYSSRLRQQPKPTQIYQPDPTPPRATRMRTTHSPQPLTITGPTFANVSSDPRDPSFKIDNYEPPTRAAGFMTLNPVMTPRTDPEVFSNRKSVNRLVTMSRQTKDLPQDLLKATYPKATFDGPNIYIRCVQGLKSGIRREQDFALHHLVKVSKERGDKFKLEGFPTLGEALMEKIVEITQLAFGVEFQVSYGDAYGRNAENTLNAVHGTRDLRQKLAALPPIATGSGITSKDEAARLERLNEATLVLRNMVTLEDNSYNVSRTALFRDVLVLILNLPQLPEFDEIRQYGLDMAEMTTRYYDMAASSDLYDSLVDTLASEDRGKLIPALRAIYRFDAEADRIHFITGISLATIEKLFRYCVLDDDELVEAVIDFLYAWTAHYKNVTWLLEVQPELLFNSTLRFSNLFTRGATVDVYMQPDKSADHAVLGPQIPAAVPYIPPDLHNQLLQFPEPERSSCWLRCCYEEAQHEDVTQISIWQAYSSRFAANNPIVAAEFIKNVGKTLRGAEAQVVTGPNGQRFIIKGIRPRRILVNLQEQPYYKCHWLTTTIAPVPTNYEGPMPLPHKHPCGTWHASPIALWHHLLEHAGIPVPADGKIQPKDITVPPDGYQCDWLGCRKNIKIDSVLALGTHLRIHVPENAEQNKQLIYRLANVPLKNNEVTTVKFEFYSTPTDKDHVAYGIPFMSCLLLSNLARYVGRSGNNTAERQLLMGRLFSGQVKSNLFGLLCKHQTLRRFILDLIDLIEKGEASDESVNKQRDDPDAMLF